ncbi:MAG: hypothetical protein GC160_15990 [Acidobacteria bacterium]|nr:hypothetical protein [Acidobacteriota bacterium]
MNGFLLIAFLLAAAALPASDASHAEWERQRFDGGVELHTLFSVTPDPAGGEAERTPVISVLRDTLGDDDPNNDRLRYVWLLAGQERRGVMKWLIPEPELGDMPKPLVDLAAPGKGVWKTVLRRAVQASLLDPSGVGVRISSRSYWSGRRASRTVRLYEALSVMLLREQASAPGGLTAEQRKQVLARTFLADSTLGGLAPDSSLDRIVEQELSARRQSLGRNWELLRQRAEEEGLIFQPIGMDDEPAIAAMLWVSRADLETPRGPFRSKFLGISDPWKDPAVHEWAGYTEIWRFDSDGRRTDDDAAAVRREELIPLALYSLDHPKIPFLLIDFRSSWKPALRETARRTLEEAPRTVLGMTAYANVELRAAQFALTFIRSRRGAPVQRRDRLRATVAVRQTAQAVDPVAPALREQLAERLGTPTSPSTRRYESLLAWAGAPDGLARRIEKDRGRELARLLHPGRARWTQALTVATVGLYRYREPLSPERLALLDRERRLSTAVDVLETAVESSPRIDVGVELDSVRLAARELSGEPSLDSDTRKRADEALRALAAQPLPEEMRRELAAWRNQGPERVAAGRAPLEGGGLD